MARKYASIEGTPGPTYGGGYRVRIYSGSRVVATSHFPVPASHRTHAKVLEGIALAYKAAKKYAAAHGCK